MLNEIFRVVSCFPRVISCYISENRFPLGQWCMLWGPPGVAKSLCVLSPFYSIVPSGSGLPSVEFVPDLELTGSMPYI